jgi:hypothetical protein
MSAFKQFTEAGKASEHKVLQRENWTFKSSSIAGVGRSSRGD